MADPIFTSYVAGFFDGEGSIQLYMAMRANKNGKDYLRSQLYVSVTQLDPTVLNRLKDEFGGNVYERRPRATKSGEEHRRWDWVATSKVALSFLEAIRPYLIVKAEEADCAIEFGHTMLEGNTRLGVPPEVLLRRTELAQRIIEIRDRKKRLAYDFS
jgi:hypothetical protein